jgi:hypothetical protein
MLRTAPLGLLAALGFALAASAQAVIEEPSQAPVTAEVLESGPERVTFQLANRSDHPVRDVEVLVSHVFQWANEFAPGRENPSRAATYRVPVELGPHESREATYELAAPLPPRSDGRFETRVEVLRWTDVLRPVSRLEPSCKSCNAL